MDALVLLADNNEDRLKSAQAEIEGGLNGIGRVFVETGEKKVDENGND
ncbi:MAG: hypothetical protein IPJ00_09370 [Saprospirales bacterium]|nr:hypothetical protein [Saprospirales bacterium]